MRLQKFITGMTLVCAMLLMTSTAFANTVSFDYASIGNAKIKFQNGHFTFSNSTLAGPTLG